MVNKIMINLLMTFVTTLVLLEILYEKLTTKAWHRKTTKFSHSFIPEVERSFIYITMQTQCGK